MKRILGLIGLLWILIATAEAKMFAPLISPQSVPYDVTEGLNGRTVALWGSHGLYFNEQQDRWKWQRAHVWTTVEDLFTTSFTAPYLVPMLENAGAMVMQPRAYVRPGYQTIYVRWTETKRPRVQKIVLVQGKNALHYRVNTAIGVGVWHYLCTIPKGDFWLKGADALSIDESTVGPSGKPRYMEAARYWLPYIGVPDSVWVVDSTYTDYLNDIVCRGGWVNYMNRDIPVDVCLALHTDAGTTMNDSIIGSMAIYTDYNNDSSLVLTTGDSCSISRDLADSVLTQVVEDISRIYGIAWTRRDLRQANYGETRIPMVPAIILEMLSHQNYADMTYALDPHFRFAMARAIYKGVGHFLAGRSGQHFVPQPLPPVALRTAIQEDSVCCTWQPQTDTLDAEATPTYYIVYTRVNGGWWNLGTRVEQPRFSCLAAKGKQYDFYVVAGNAGGISMASSVVSACRVGDNPRPMLVVDAFPEVRGPKMMAFDSLTGGVLPSSRPIPDGWEMAYVGEQINYNRWDPWHNDDDCGFGMSTLQRQGQLLVGNTHDYTSQHGTVLCDMRRSYVSCTMDALTMADSIYTDVDIILGKSHPAMVRQMNTWVTQLHWAEGNRHVLMSGAYVGYPNHACASGVVQIDCADYTFHQELNTTHLSAEDVSALSKNAPSDAIVARYSDTSLPAIIRNTNYTIVGFPLECLDDFEKIYKLLIQR